MSDIKKVSDHSFAAHCLDGRVFILANNVGSAIDSTFLNLSGNMGEAYPQGVGGYQIVPFGADNQLPSHIRDIVDSNNLVPGIIERQAGLLFGQGVFLNQLIFRDGEISHLWMEDKDVQEWLNSWDYISYIKGCMVDYLHLKGFFDAKYLTKGHRIGRIPKIAYLEHIPAKNARLEWAETRKLKDVKHIIVGDFENYCTTTGVRRYPVFDRRDPGKHAASASYNNTYSFARDFYSVPQFWGALRWIVRGSEIPLIFKYVTDNGLNLAYHIHSNSAYWDYRRNVLRGAHPDWSDAEV